MNPFDLQVSHVVYEERLQNAAHRRHLNFGNSAHAFLSRLDNVSAALAAKYQLQWGMPRVNPPAPEYPVIIF